MAYSVQQRMQEIGIRLALGSERGTLRGQEFRIGETGAPVLKHCLAYFECRIADELAGGDHTIFLGEVVDAAVVSEGKPLVFYRGGYAELA